MIFLAKLSHTFKNRDNFVEESRLANFNDVVLKEKDSNTEDFINKTKPSDYSKSGILDMSKLHRRHLSHGRQKMDVFHIDIDNLRERAMQYVTGIGKVTDFDGFLMKECEYIQTFRRSLAWLEENVYGYDEASLQLAYVLYMEGLLSEMGSDYSVYSVNGLSLQTEIDVKRKGKKLREDVSLHGKTDCAIGIQKLFPLSVDDIVSSCVTIIELKVNQGPLQEKSGAVGKCTSQQCAEMLALADMRKKSGLDCRIVRSILTDLFFIRIAFRLEFSPDPVKYLISSLSDNIEFFVLATI